MWSSLNLKKFGLTSAVRPDRRPSCRFLFCELVNYCPVYFHGYGLRNLNQAYHHFFAKTTRMHSGRMRTARSLTMGVYLSGGVPARGCTCLGVVPTQEVYLPKGCTCPGGTCLAGVPVRGVYLPGGCTYLGVYLARGCTAQGVPIQGRYLPGGCTCPGGYLPGGVPARGEFLTHYWKYLPQLRCGR